MRALRLGDRKALAETMNILVGFVVVALIVYLFASVLKPEWF
jgi:hypothetical protein